MLPWALIAIGWSAEPDPDPDPEPEPQLDTVPDRPLNSGIHGELYGGTLAPVSVGLGVELRLSRFRVAVELGGLPGSYARLINTIAVGAGAYDEQTGELVISSLDESAVFHIDVGGYPLKNHGLYGAIGTSAATLGGTSTSTAILELALGTELGWLGQLFALPVDVSTSVALFELRAGWRFYLDDRRKFTLRTEVGYIEAGGSSNEVTIAAVPQPLLTAALDEHMDGIYRQYVRAPTIAVWVGWHFARPKDDPATPP